MKNNQKQNVKYSDLSFDELELLAEQGYIDAQFNLKYYKKYCVEEAKWYAKAAEQGNKYAQFYFGVCYEWGKGVEQDYAKAAEWYKKAAEQGHNKAQYNLGICYEDGAGVEKDTAEAVYWYTQAAEQGYAEAQYNLAICYQDGIGVATDLSKAIKWYIEAAKDGMAEAQCNLAVYYQEGKGVRKNRKKAFKLFTKAAEQGNHPAQFSLALCYQYGRGVEIDPAKAVEWYKMAAIQGFAMAQNNLAECYKDGFGVEKNIIEAKIWYSKAVEQGDPKAQKALNDLLSNPANAEILKKHKKALKEFKKKAGEYYNLYSMVEKWFYDFPDEYRKKYMEQFDTTHSTFYENEVLEKKTKDFEEYKKNAHKDFLKRYSMSKKEIRKWISETSDKKWEEYMKYIEPGFLAKLRIFYSQHIV